MKKKTLFTFVASTAVVVTAAGSYAAWDTTSATATSNEIHISKVEVEIGALSMTQEGTRVLDTAPTYKGNVDVDLQSVEDSLQKNVKLELTPKVVDTADTDLTTQFDIVVSQINDNTLAGGTGPGATTDTVLDFTNTKNSYSVSITPKDGGQATLDDKAVKVIMTADLKNK